MASDIWKKIHFSLTCIIFLIVYIGFHRNGTVICFRLNNDSKHEVDMSTLGDAWLSGCDTDEKDILNSTSYYIKAYTPIPSW